MLCTYASTTSSMILQGGRVGASQGGHCFNDESALEGRPPTHGAGSLTSPA
jgi:hypothetical protein